ncbi:leucine--tRNA ligase [Thalassoglobus polymorphus]|uniref:Leucine--tRNA ligase n=1 Tax=Thalassoglobus polymorphus TaxID=2527994 RepID=A0A517QUG3_9PLAN|nr:leucine--tRNA ligase [Thalassoglobus polymorphus]QDT35286.1 Leucine--tRNA ligase [Thalassoglobus polymorphus]
MPRYEPKQIEPKWQQFWDANQTFTTSNEPREDASGKSYILDMFPYPSGSGLHVGHPEGYTATDIIARYHRMRGKHVLHPMGWDAFGLPAEQHAINTGTHPRVTTYQNIDNFRRQLKMLGFSYDWTREISTTDEDYYRWTQWIFLQLYNTWYDADYEWTDANGKKRIGKGRPISELPIPENVVETHLAPSDPPGDVAIATRRYQDAHRLAYQSDAPVNWCPELGTVLANEEVTAEGLSDRGGFPVERRSLRQWMLRITSYAERLLTELEDVDWPESVKILQRNWIGKSIGAEVDFFVDAENNATQFAEWKADRAANGLPASPEPNVLRVYTTRPDTLFGATYMVVAPEHDIVDSITTDEQKAEVEEYRHKAALKSDLDRTDLAKGKSGVFTGAYAVNPVNEERIPIWIADYVLISYGTGAIMAVPAHDERDLEFAQTFDINVIEVVDSGSDDVDNIGFTGNGTAINSGKYTGTPTAEFKKQIASELNESGLGKAATNYRLRDWLFSRQRYWGEPFPIWHELDDEGKPTGHVRPVAEDELPVTLPNMEDFKPKGTPDPPLSWAPDEWLYQTAEDGTRLMRETNSMPQWAGSCWYYLRFADNKNSDKFINPDMEKYWLPVDLYIGGAEHAVLHLLYSRFWHKVLFDCGHVSTEEPFQKLINQGMILGENNEKMSKSRGNVVNPDDVVREYGADSLRLYEMFMGPLDQVKPWSTKGVEGVHRFLGRAWRLIVDDQAEEIALCSAVQDASMNEEQERVLHKTIKGVTDDIEKFSFNTAISKMMEFTNFFTGQEVRSKSAMESFVLLLAPFAPHVAEELWQVLGHNESLTYAPWPSYDDSKIVEAEIEIPVQVNGKMRAKIKIPVDADQATMQSLAENNDAIKPQLEGKTIVKVICVPKRMVNFVVKG